MDILKAFLLILASLAGMEAFSWFIHKYLFHGPLWFIHKTHHRHDHKKLFELNDIFSLLFGGVSMYLMFVDREGFGTRFWIGAGISLYGIIYFVFHDWFIHGRIKSFRTGSRYLKAIRKAHRIHHKSAEKQPSEEYGLLTASKKYFKKEQ